MQIEELIDQIYILYLLNRNDLINIIFSKLTDSKKDYLLNLHFSIKYRNILCEIINYKKKEKYTQEEIDNVLYELSIFFYENKNLDFLNNRNFKKETLEYFKVGSTHIIFDNKEKTQEFINKLLKKYNNEVVKDLFRYFLATGDSLNKNFQKPYSITFPDIDNKQCKGLVTRSIGYKPIHDKIRNVFKFFCTNQNEFIFNSSCLKNNKDIIIVEGVFDLLSLYEIGFKNVTTFSNTRMCQDVLNNFLEKDIKIIFDNDLGGNVGLDFFYENYHNVLSLKYYRFDLDEHKDIDEARTKNPKRLLSYINTL